ncbi:unnamed protein product, partial [marine sediment metagenome]
EKSVPTIGDILAGMFRTRVRKHLGFALFVSMDRQATVLLTQIPLILVGRFVQDNAAAGHYRIGMNIVATLWAGFLGFSKNLLPYLSEFKGRNDFRTLKDRFLKITFFSGAAAIVIGGAFCIVARRIIGLFYGDDFLPVVPIIYVLMGRYVFISFGIATGHFYIVSNRVKFAISIKVLFFLASLAPAIILIKRWEAFGAAVWHSCLISAVMAV